MSSFGKGSHGHNGRTRGLQRAEAILKLRSLKTSRDLPTYLVLHFCQAHKRNYPGPPITELLEVAA